MNNPENSFSLTIILPNFNGESLLKSNLPSLLEAIGQYEYEIIVVDDCSEDDSVRFLEQNYPQVIIIKNSENIGFSGTCNRGINTATKNFICIANTDVTFTADYFKNAEKSFTTPDIFAVKGDIINYGESFDDVSVIERTFLLYYQHGFLRFNPNVEPEETHNSPELNTQLVLLGCCFICRREILQQLSGYDEIYSPFYWEDSDLAHRALQSGYQLRYNSECKVYHHLSSTISVYHSKRKRHLISYRNKFLFTWHHLNGFNNWLLHLLFTLLNLMTRWIILDWRYYIAFFQAIFRHFTFPKIINQHR